MMLRWKSLMRTDCLPGKLLVRFDCWLLVELLGCSVVELVCGCSALFGNWIPLLAGRARCGCLREFAGAKLLDGLAVVVELLLSTTVGLWRFSTAAAAGWWMHD